MGRSHMLSGATVWLLGSAGVHAMGGHPDLFGTAVGTLVCTGSALIPDLDHGSSRATRAAGVLTLGLSGVLRWVSREVHAATRTELDRRNESGHRALTHTFVFAVAAGLLAVATVLAVSVWVPVLAGWWWLGGAVSVGCLAHVAGDSLTVSGVPLLWPLVIRGRRWAPLGVRRIRTDHVVERWVVWPLLAAGAVVGGWCSIA